MILDAQALYSIRPVSLAIPAFTTYHRPTENIAEAASLRRSGICIAQMAGSGRIRRNKSMATFPAPWNTTRIRVRVHSFEMKAARKSSREDPCGAHMAANVMDIERWKATMKTIPAIDAMRIQLRTLKTCKYSIRTEVLTAQMDSGRVISTRRDN